MATRRGFNQAFANVQGMIDALIKQKIAGDQQMKTFEAQELMRRETDQMQNQQLTGRQALGDLSRDPRLAERLAGAGQSQLGGQDVANFQRSQGERMLPVLEGIEGATSLGTLPSAQTSFARARAEGIEADPAMGGDQFNPQKINLPGFEDRTHMAFPIRGEGESRSPIEEIMRARQAEEAKFAREAAVTEGYKPRLVDVGAGEAVTGFEGRGGQTFATERTGTAEGIRGLHEWEANDANPARIEREAEVANTMEILTRDEQIDTTSRDAYARTRGGLQAQVDMAPAMIESGVMAPAAGGQMDDLEVGKILTPLLADLALIEELEANGTTLPYFPTQQMESPFLQSLSQTARLSSDEQIQMLNGANQWATKLTREFSGVQSRVDEFNKFVTSLFALTSDSPTVIAQKRNRRNAYLAAIMAGKRGGERAGGRAFGNAIAGGLIDEEAMTYFDFGDEFAAGINETVGNDLPMTGVQ